LIYLKIIRLNRIELKLFFKKKIAMLSAARRERGVNRHQIADVSG